MNWKTRLENNYRLWFCFSAAIFVGLWFLPTGQSPKSPEIRAMFDFWRHLLHPDAVGAVLLLTFFFAITAAIAGWVLHTMVVVVVVVVVQLQGPKKSDV